MPPPAQGPLPGPHLLHLAQCLVPPSRMGLEALPHPSTEYQQGYKLVNDRLPQARLRLHRRRSDALARKQGIKPIRLI
ncbi:hypothetical protein QJQ45_006960 [Haematococcus lacustris]|nr:hypothetical protein QJQ45_006960 [Haematococcus lacustris]